MMPDDIQEVIAKVLFFLFATILLCMTQSYVALL